MVRSLALWAAVAHAPAVLAAEAAAPPRPPAPASPPAYVSAFAGYQPYREPTRAPWKGVNEEVGRIGGHAGYVRDAAPPPQPPRLPPAETKR